MPKTKKEFIKITLELFEDDNYFTMTPLEQLVYVKLIAINKRKHNQTPKKLDRLIALLKLQLSPSDLRVMLKRFKRRFSNFKSNRWFYYWEDYDRWYADGKEKEFNGTDKGMNKNQIGGVEKENRDKSIEKENRGRTPPLPNETFFKAIKENPAYKHIDINRELAKMDAWLLVHKGRQKTKRFIVNWLNKIDRPIDIQKHEPRPKPGCDVCKGTGYIEIDGKKGKCFCW